MSYFIHDGNSQLGPFTIEDLKQKKIISTTPVWKEGMADWAKASDFSELNEIVHQLPPTFNPGTSKQPSMHVPASLSEKAGFRLGRFLGWGGVIIIVIFIGLYLYNKPYGSPHPVYSTIPFIDPEHARPNNYLSASGTYHPNFWNNKEDISGVITNNATHTNYKDIHIRVSFMSQTNTVISSLEYVIYEFVPYGSSKNFKLTVDKPAAAATCGWVAVGGTYY